MTKETRTICPYCGVGCGVIARVEDDGQVSVKGDPDHPSNFGRLCSKGLALADTISMEGRLLAPQIQGADANWDDALNLVAQKFSETIKQYGADATAFYVSGQLLTEDYYVANKLMKGYIGSANIDTNSRLCMASSVAGHKRAFGTDTVPCNYEDLEEAELIVLVGSNMAWCHPVLFQRIMAEKEKRPNLKLVVLDPRRTASAEMADLHIPISAGDDIAIFNALLCQIQALGAIDMDYVANHVEGFGDALDAASCTSCFSHPQFEEFTRLWIENEKVVTIYSQGVNQSKFGTDKVNAIINCHLATGRIGKPGMGPFSLTGQPNAMGGREVGGLANMLANHLDIENPSHRDAVRMFWNAPNLASQTGLKAVDMFDAVERGEIKALWIMSTNPAVSMPEAERVKAAIEKCDFVVVSDIQAQTDTTALADVLLPATGWGEKTGAVTNSERMISTQKAFLPAPKGTRPDWQIICDVATRMGFGDGFDFENPAEIFREYAALSSITKRFGLDFDIADFAEISNADYADFTPTRWPLNRADNRFFADGKFYTSTGKGQMIAIRNRAQNSGELRLNTGRIRDQWHTMTRSAKSAKLSQHLAEPFLEIHPLDAQARGIKSAELVRVFNPSGEVILRANVTERTPQGQVFAPMHWTSEWAANGRIDKLVHSVVDPISGQPDLKSAICEIEPFQPQYFGFAISREKPKSTAPYWALAKTDFGWRMEFAANERPALETIIAQIWNTDLPDLNTQDITTAELSRGVERAVIHSKGKAEIAIYLSPKPVALSRAFLIDNFTTLTPMELLAGNAGQDRPDPGPVVCSCFNIGQNTINRAIADENLQTLEEVGECLQAGTNCGSCRAEIRALLAQAQHKTAAE